MQDIDYSLINSLEAQREKIRQKEMSLTQEIKKERQRISSIKKEQKPAPQGVPIERYRAIERENSRLKGLFCLLKKAEGTTYKEVGAIIGLSGSRVKYLIDREKRHLWRADREET